MDIEFKPDIYVSWGYWKCNSCGSEYGLRSTPIHSPDCSAVIDNSNGHIVYCYGIKEVDLVLQSSDGRSKCGDLTRRMLEDMAGEQPLEVQKKLREWKNK